MPGLREMEVPAGPRGATLVSVDGRVYPLKSARIAAEASGGIASSKLVQTFSNPYAEPLEVSYTMPLPADAAVVGYAMKLGERVIRGEVRPREEALEAYKKALFEGRAAGLLEQDRDDTFTQRLGALPAGQDAEITIEVLHPVAFLAGDGAEGPQWEYRFPTVVGVRYQGAAGRVPDADRLDADRAAASGEIPTRIELSLTTIHDEGTTERRIENMPLDRDLVVRWPAGTAAIGARLVEGPGLPGDDGRYGSLTITPPRVPAAAFARDLTLLIDASGSMSGKPLEWAKDVASGLLRSLEPGDRFDVVAFSGSPRSLTGGVVKANDENLSAVLAELARLRANGGTEMLEAVVEALRPLRSGAQHQVVLITDGAIGFEDEVVARIAGGLADGARLHTVGVGAAPNRTLTSRAARAGRGVEAFVCGDDEVAATARRLLAATAHPVLTDLRITGNAVRGSSPARPRDVLAGQPLVVSVELAPHGGVAKVTGQLAGSSEPWTCSITVPPADSREITKTTVPVGALYGRETIADLEMWGERHGDQVLAVAMRHKIASRATSLVAVSEEPTVDPNAPRRRVDMPVEVPAFVSAEAVGLGTGLHGVSDLFLCENVSRPMSRHAPMRSPMYDMDPRLVGSSERLEDELSEYRERVFISARVLRVEDDMLVVEYESPHDGFLSPKDTVDAAVFGQPLGACAIVSGNSTAEGRHAKGLVLRLAVRRPYGVWKPGVEIELAWGEDQRIVLSVVIPGSSPIGGRTA